jgi:hypothetical protein
MPANTQVLTLTDGRSILLSYGVPVAAFIPEGWTVDRGMVAYRSVAGYIQTAERHSATTSRHVNAWAGKTAPRIPPAHWRAFVDPVRVP